MPDETPYVAGQLSALRLPGDAPRRPMPAALDVQHSMTQYRRIIPTPPDRDDESQADTNSAATGSPILYVKVTALLKGGGGAYTNYATDRFIAAIEGHPCNSIGGDVDAATTVTVTCPTGYSGLLSSVDHASGVAVDIVLAYLKDEDGYCRLYVGFGVSISTVVVQLI